MTDPKSDTPITDELYGQFSDQLEKMLLDGELVPAVVYMRIHTFIAQSKEHAQKLERQLAKAESERDRLREQLQELRDTMLERFLSWRGVENVCEGRNGCGGSGTKTYASTATWRGGAGGQALTSAVCDQCWGSGDKSRP